MRQLLFNALSRMHQSEFIIVDPDGSEHIIESIVTSNIMRHIFNIADEMADLGGYSRHYDLRKGERGFQYILGRDRWQEVRQNYRDLFQGNGRGSVRPDICVHRSENILFNALAIEIKCRKTSAFDIYHDLRKLRLYTDPNILGFNTGIFLHVGSGGRNDIDAVREWGEAYPRKVPNHLNTPAARLAREQYIATPASVNECRYYIWQIDDLDFYGNGLFDPQCITEHTVENDTFNHPNFVDEL
nr:hypothetical protein [Acetobacter syzygii]